MAERCSYYVPVKKRRCRAGDARKLACDGTGPCISGASESGARRPVSRVLFAIGSARPMGRWPFIWDVRYRTPRATYPGGGAENRSAHEEPAAPTWSCSGWGLPCRPRCRERGALLPHPFTLARPPDREARGPGGLLSVALSLGSPPPAVNRHRASVEPGLSSPRRVSPFAKGGHPTVWKFILVG